MSTTKCELGNTSGFPINISASASSLFSKSGDTIQQIIVPTDFTVNWGLCKNSEISVSKTTQVEQEGLTIPAKCQITGFDDFANGTTLTYGEGNANYSCSSVLSIVTNQHTNLKLNTEEQALYEVILAFQIVNKRDNPSSPDIILLTRPIVLTDATNPLALKTPLYWTQIKQLLTSSSPSTRSAELDLSSMFAYDRKILMPMLSYQTCLPVKLTSGAAPSLEGSFTIRVNVILNPIYLGDSATALGTCENVTKYTLVTSPAAPANVFGISGIGVFNHLQPKFQFNISSGPSGAVFPTSTNINNLSPNKATDAISSLADIMKKIEIVVPDALLGKSLADVANSPTTPKITNNANTKFKCYPVDPSTDIVNGQIMIDPTTGQRLEDTLKERSLESSGGITISSLPSPGMLPGDIEEIFVITIVAILAIGLTGYISYVIYNFIYFGNMQFSEILFHFGVIIAILTALILTSILLAEKTK